MIRNKKKVIITGSTGLIGSECVFYFDRKGWEVHGIDNNIRKMFFGEDGDTNWNLDRINCFALNYTHHNIDIRMRDKIIELFDIVQPDYVIHCAAQPSHDLAASIPFDDFDINAQGTINLLEASRRHSPSAPFCFMSTNKVYGDAPNEIKLKELKTRWDYDDDKYIDGIDELLRIDQSKHSLFGASKLAADIMVQEYGKYFDMPTVCFRCGCLTGPAHSGAELHGFFSYLIKCTKEDRKYNIYGYKGKQVRDNAHSFDICRAVEEFFNNPGCGEVFNLGGGRENSVSIIEAISYAEECVGKKLKCKYVDKNREGDHICYISNLTKMKKRFAHWSITKSLNDIFVDIDKALFNNNL